MARLTGILKLTGSLDGLSFYKFKGETVVRKSWGPNKQRIRNDPAFAHIKAHGKEFGACAKDSKLLRTALRHLLKNTADNRITPRVNS